MKRILITGGNGYIAKSLYSSFKDLYEVTTISRTNFDLRNAESLSSWFKSQPHFDMVIHTAIDGGNRLKKEDFLVVDNNLQMYYNLLQHRRCYDKFISIGSGAELYALDTPYGLSKHIIRHSISNKDRFYNIRVFAVFDENELDTRFIKSNVLRYINKKPMVIHQDKKMDFFYMEDFIKVIKYYIESDSPPKEFNCTYEKSYYLSDIARRINRLSNYAVDITVNSETHATDYIGVNTPINISFAGMDFGIQTLYKKLLWKI